MAVAKVERVFDLKPKHIKLIDKVIAQIEAYPEHVDMSSWYDPDPFGECEVEGTTSAKKAFSCDTTCCIAGHALLAARYPLKEFITGNEKKGLKYSGEIPDVAAKLLGLKSEDIGDFDSVDNEPLWKVFLHSKWPPHLAVRYENATTNKQRAKAMIARLKYLKKYGA